MNRKVQLLTKQLLGQKLRKDILAVHTCNFENSKLNVQNSFSRDSNSQIPFKISSTTSQKKPSLNYEQKYTVLKKQVIESENNSLRNQR